jgi:hypothetical protein
MKARVNTHALQQIRLDSAQLGVLGMIAHPLPEAGTYYGTVNAGEMVAARFALEVADAAQEVQADIDLARLAHPKAVNEPPLANLAVRSGGYLMLYVSEGPGRYTVLLDRAPADTGDQAKGKRVFDSARLAPGDVFVATLLRPGVYKVTEAMGGSDGTIRIASATSGDKPYRVPAPTTVRVTADGLDPREITTDPGQGVVFAIERPAAAITVELQEPDQGLQARSPDIRARVRRTIVRRYAGP